MTNTTAPALTADTPVLRTFASGTVDYAITDEIHVGVRADGAVYWASEEGWAWVVATARVESLRILGDSTGWPSMWHDDYYLAHPVARPADCCMTPSSPGRCTRGADGRC